MRNERDTTGIHDRRMDGSDGIMTRIGSVFALAGLGLLVGACAGGDEAQGSPAGATSTERAVPVSAIVTTSGDLQVRMRGSTTLAAREVVDVLPRQGGLVAQVLVEEGDQVGEGQTLLQLDDEQWRLQLQQSEARYRAMVDRIERSRALAQMQLITAQEVQNLVSDSAVVAAELALAELTVRNASVSSPIRGIVTHRRVQRGQQVGTGEVVFTVADLENLEASVAVSERDSHRISVGQEARILLEEGAEPIATGTVERIRPVVDPGSGTVQVTVRVAAQEDQRLRPGRFVHVDIVTELLTERISLPRTAILVDGAAPRVYLYRGGRAVEQEVTLGHSQGTRVEIARGVSAGDTVIVVGQENLRPEVPLRLMQLDGATVVEGNGSR